MGLFSLAVNSPAQSNCPSLFQDFLDAPRLGLGDRRTFFYHHHVPGLCLFAFNMGVIFLRAGQYLADHRMLDTALVLALQIQTD